MRGGDELLKRFDALPYAHKVVFVPEPVEGIKSAVCLKNYDASKKIFTGRFPSQESAASINLIMSIL